MTNLPITDNDLGCWIDGAYYSQEEFDETLFSIAKGFGARIGRFSAKYSDECAQKALDWLHQHCPPGFCIGIWDDCLVCYKYDEDESN